MNHHIARLNRSLAKDGEDVILRRVVGLVPNTMNIDVAVRATVTAYAPEELVGGITQTDSRVIMGPSEIAAAHWPGGEVAGPNTPDPSLPRVNDKLIVDGRIRNVMFVNAVAVHNELVRIELRISG